MAPKRATKRSATDPAEDEKPAKLFPIFQKKGAAEPTPTPVSTTDTPSTSEPVDSGEKVTLPDYPLLENLKDEGWRKALAPEFEKPYFKKIIEFLDKEKAAKKEIFPPEKDVFSAFNHTPLDKVKVVIIGQDPYHDNNQAHGLCFSVRPGIKTPPSLVNIYKEMATDLPGFKVPSHGCLVEWAREGVLLLNATLTVQAHQANSHKDSGWQQFTDAVIQVSIVFRSRHYIRSSYLTSGLLWKRVVPALSILAHCLTSLYHSSLALSNSEHFLQQPACLIMPLSYLESSPLPFIGWLRLNTYHPQIISQKRSNVVFLLWGGFAQKKEKLINKQKNHVVIGTIKLPLTSGCRNRTSIQLFIQLCK
eukprot:TRINITY_DN770_c0_g1_i2.p1 TRINITY_DN770_c0_g1~~TRINITY_DN770_c0_g1_i2.p1  ORF type:complete len:362 (-),score=72.00 TRINITY_DN770_c0_g1_i2:416-1501(-)